MKIVLISLLVGVVSCSTSVSNTPVESKESVDLNKENLPDDGQSSSEGLGSRQENGHTDKSNRIEEHQMWDDVKEFCLDGRNVCTIGAKGIVVDFGYGPHIEYTEDETIQHFTPEQIERAKKYHELLVALNSGNFDNVKKCLVQGANPRDTWIYSDYEGVMIGNPMNIVIGDIDTVKLLLDSGADPDYCCCSCETALHAAIKKKHVDVVALLLQYGADTQKLYNSEFTAIQLAEDRGSPEIANLLKKHFETTESQR